MKQHKIDKFIKGNKRFQNVHFQEFLLKFENLVKYGQKPKVLFIGCSDSRVVPDLIVDSKPGDMFVLRNVGNFVPPYSNSLKNSFHGNSSAIEYAVSVLEVEDIIVCGHSHCGACAALYQDLSDKPNLEHLNRWLDLGRDAKQQAMALNLPNHQDTLIATEKISIVTQLDNLLTYPEVYKKVQNGKLHLHGWYYKLEDGTIEAYNGEENSFEVL